MQHVQPERIRPLNSASRRNGPILYWMSRDQRVHDNWALLYAQELAREAGSSVEVVFCLVPNLNGAQPRHYGFMLEGLQQVADELARFNIPFRLLRGAPQEALVGYAGECGAGALVTDFSPLRHKQAWNAALSAKLTCVCFEVDAHNIVPAWHVSHKQEFGAYTLRPKINRLLPAFLTDFPKLAKQEGSVERTTLVIPEYEPYEWKPGERAARAAAETFVDERLHGYDKRNDPMADAQSDLSPYLHFGQLSAQRLALMAHSAPARGKAEFLEELIVRRELSDNFCLHNPHYDSFEGAPAWAKLSLDAHRADSREYAYSRDEWERAQTHDELWNAAQREMMRRGKLHGYMRMYWAKKLLEWSTSPEEAIATAVYLNDTYELDGRDPNGYAGIMWSICGLHDRAWFDRPVYGKIRYMNRSGCEKKFDVEGYIARWS